MNQRGFATLAIVLIFVALFALSGGWWYFEVHRTQLQQASAIQPRSLTVQSGTANPQLGGALIPLTTTSTTSDISPSAQPRQSSTFNPSLHAIVELHEQDALKLASNPQLFEVRTSLTASQINASATFLSYAFTSFFSPQDGVNYVEVDEWFSTGTAKRNFSVNSLGFVVDKCTGGPASGSGHCNGPTGQPENPSEHLPIQNWNIDVGDIIRILKANTYDSTGSSDVIVTTVGRAKYQNYSFWPQSPSALGSSPDSRSIILIVGATGWMALSAESGAVLGSGAYNPPPQPV